ncbi:MAG: hypothetical protein ACLGIN_06860 [Candidatus Sericytochromatia bacterium]
MAHEVELKDLIVQLQEGSRIMLQRNELDQLITTGFEPAPDSKKYQPADIQPGLLVVGFGPWPTWSTNVKNAQATAPDEESGLFEPERLFVLREQYLFLAAPEVAAEAKPISLGPIHKVWWVGTEHIVQARRVTARH